jgi:hypothetical protein
MIVFPKEGLTIYHGGTEYASILAFPLLESYFLDRPRKVREIRNWPRMPIIKKFFDSFFKK